MWSSKWNTFLLGILTFFIMNHSSINRDNTFLQCCLFLRRITIVLLLHCKKHSHLCRWGVENWPRLNGYYSNILQQLQQVFFSFFLQKQIGNNESFLVSQPCGFEENQSYYSYSSITISFAQKTHVCRLVDPLIDAIYVVKKAFLLYDIIFCTVIHCLCFQWKHCLIWEAHSFVFFVVLL